MSSEDEKLRRYMDKCKLNEWYQSCQDLAKSSVEEELNEETEGGRHMKEIAQELRKIENSIAKSGQQEAQEMLTSRPRYEANSKLKGSTYSLRNSIRS
jgi:nuclear pore complex protein Nup133